MNTVAFLFIIPLLVIFSYIFDAFARKTKFPSVILLMLTGLISRTIINYYEFYDFSFLDSLIPVLGTIGLILIVLEGALELKISKEKFPIMIKGFLAALIILILNILILEWTFRLLFGIENDLAILLSIPLSIISSAVAIPSASSLLKIDREFIIYESVFSDILGIMIFNYALVQVESGTPLFSLSLISLSIQIVGVILISLIITYFLIRFLQQIKHNVKFFLILSILILVYAIGKFLHLPSLVTIFIFGIVLNNIKIIFPKFLGINVNVEETNKSLNEFHLLTSEFTFLVRTFFFLFFGFSISITDFNSIDPIIYGVLIFALMFIVRFVYIYISNLNLNKISLVFFSPRGLISILLFLQLKEIEYINILDSNIDERVLLVVILSSMFVMLKGTSVNEEIVYDNEEGELLKYQVEEEESDPDNLLKNN